MMKKLAIALAVIMLAIVAWALFFEGGDTRIIINGHELTGPLKGAIGVAGLIVGSIAFLCAAILLAFVVTGVGLFVLGCVIVGGLILAGLAFPFLLLLLVPLAVVWIFVAVMLGTKT